MPDINTDAIFYSRGVYDEYAVINRVRHADCDDYSAPHIHCYPGQHRDSHRRDRDRSGDEGSREDFSAPNR